MEKFEPEVSAQPSYTKLVQVTKQCTESELFLVWHEIFTELCIQSCSSLHWCSAVYLAWGVCYSLHVYMYCKFLKCL